MKRWIEGLILGVLLVAGFGVRLYKIGNPIADWHSWRQADTASVSRIYLAEGIDLLTPRYYDVSRIQTGSINPKGLRLVEFPIYNALHAGLAGITAYCPSFSEPVGKLRYVYRFFFPMNLKMAEVGTPCFEIWGRLVSIAAGLASAFFLYLMGKRLMGVWGGLAAAAFYLFLPYNIYFTRVILPEPLSVALGVAAVWLFMEYLERDKFWVLALSGILFAASTLVKPFTFFYAIPLVYLAVKKYGWVKSVVNIKLWLFANLAVVPFFLWRIWINQHPIGIPHFDWAFNGDKIRFQPAFWFWLFGERLGKLILGVWGVVPLALGLIGKRKNYFSVFFFLGSLVFLFIIATASVRHDYYQIFIIPSLALLVAEGALWLWKEAKVALGVICFLSLMIGMFQVKEFYKINHPEIVVAGVAADKLLPKDARVIAPYNGDTAYLYQIKRFGWPVVDESFERMIERGADYFVAVNFSDPDVAYVEKNYKVIAKTGDYMIADLHRKND